MCETDLAKSRVKYNKTNLNSMIKTECASCAQHLGGNYLDGLYALMVVILRIRDPQQTGENQ
jgi:hypothetical protein